MENADQQKNSKSHWRSYLIVAVVLLVVAGGGYGGYYWYTQSEDEPQKQRPVVSVTAAKAQQQSWRSQISAVGTVVPVQGTELTSELAGKVVEIKLRSGTRVEEGETLVELDTSSELAQLKALKPQLRQAKSDQRRAEKLIDANAISEESYEEQFAEVDRLQAEIDRQLAIIRRKQIDAPFTGELGIRMVNLGQYIQPGTPVASLQQIQPIYVDFDIPERSAGEVEVGQSVRVHVAAFADTTFEGTVTAITPLVEAATRSFTVRAEFANEKRRLRPGMFADVTVRLPKERGVITVPQTAIAMNAYGRSVFVIQSESEESKTNQSNPTVKRTFVQTGERRGLDVEVTKGIEVGTKVVTAGQIKLSDGSPVKISQ